METVPVRFRDCACPNTPHPEGDIAQLRPFLDYAGGAEAWASIRATIPELSSDDSEHNNDVLAPILGPVLIRRGVVAWNLIDEHGYPVPVTNEAVDNLSWDDAFELGNKANDLYGEQVLAPLVRRMSASSKTGLTVVSTPPPAKRSRKRRKPSASSS